MFGSFDWETTDIESLRQIDDDVEKSPYKYLNLPDDAPVDQVVRMYRMLMKKYHPDIRTIEMMRDPVLSYQRAVQINRAYEAIKRMKGTKEEWEKPQYEWRVKTDFDVVDGKYQDVDTGERVIDLESFNGELFRRDFVSDLRISKFPWLSENSQTYIEKVHEKLYERFRHLYSHSSNTINLAFSYPDESFMEGFGLEISLISLFVYLARKQKTSVAPVLVKPFLEFHKLGDIDAKEFADVLTSTNASRKGMRSIMKRFGINEILKLRKPDAAQVNDFEYDIFRLMDLTRFWNRGRFNPTFIYSAGVIKDGSLSICWTYGGFYKWEIEQFTKNDFDLMTRLVYGDNLLPIPKEGNRAITYDIRKLGTENAVVERYETKEKGKTTEQLLAEAKEIYYRQWAHESRVEERRSRKSKYFQQSRLSVNT